MSEAKNRPTGTVNDPRPRAPVRMVDSVGRALFGGSDRRPLTIEAFRRAAERKVGFDDWGLTPDYERAGELLEKDWADHPTGFVARLAMTDLFLRFHVNRLRVRRALADPPEGMGFKRPPYFVTGLFRTGTTLMHNLLSALPDRDCLPTYELMCPVPEWGRRLEAWRVIRSATFLSPETELIHPMRWDAGEECWILFSSAMRSHSWGVALDVPAYTAWIDDVDMREPYREYRAALEYVSTFRDQGLALKDPGHTPCIEALHQAIPEARIVFMHRDPATSVSSYCSLSAVHHRTYYGGFDHDTVGRKVLSRFAHYLQAAIDQRPRIADDHILDVDYHEFVDDPVAMVRRVAEHFGDPWSDEAETAVRERLAAMPRNEHGKHVYSAAQWGLTAEGIRERFGAYLREREVRREDC